MGLLHRVEQVRVTLGQLEPHRSLVLALLVGLEVLAVTVGQLGRLQPLQVVRRLPDMNLGLRVGLVVPVQLLRLGRTVLHLPQGRLLVGLAVALNKLVPLRRVVPVGLLDCSLMEALSQRELLEPLVAVQVGLGLGLQPTSLMAVRVAVVVAETTAVPGELGELAASMAEAAEEVVVEPRVELVETALLEL